MKTFLKIFLLLFFLCSNVYGKLELTKKEKAYIKTATVKVAMLCKFHPFSIYENGKLSGYSYDILQLISKKSGLKLVFEVNNWPTNLQKFKDKKVDIIDTISYKKNRSVYTDFTKSYYDIPLVIFSKKDLTDYTGLESLRGKKLGSTKNIFYREKIEKLNLFKIIDYDSFEDKLRALAFGDVDLIFGHLLNTQAAIKKSKYTNMKVLDELNLPNLKKTDLRFGIAKENQVLSSIVKKGFDSITQDEWNGLYKKWISVYTETKDLYGNKKSIIDLTTMEKDFLLNKKLKCLVSKDWAPFNFIEKDKIVGLSVDFWDLIEKKTHINATCSTVDNFEVVLNEIKNKKADITLSAAITEEKRGIGKVSKPYISFPLAIATTLDKRFISDISSLDGKKVAVGKLYSSYSILKNKYPNIKFIEVDDNYNALQLLSKGEAFAVIDILPVLSHMIGEYGFRNIKISGTTKFNFDVRFLVRNDYKPLIPILNKAISSVSKNELNKIKNRWLSVKLEEVVDYSRFWQIGIIILIVLIILFYRQNMLNKHNRRLQEAKEEIETKTIELQKKTKQLARQKKLFEKIYNESTDGIYLLKLSDRTIMDCNDSTCKMLKYSSKDEFLEQNLNDFFPGIQPTGVNSIKIMSEMIDIAIKKGSCSFEMVYQTKDKDNIWLEVVLTSITIADEEFIHTVLRDISDRKSMEERLNILTHRLEDKVKEEVRKNEEKTKQLLQQSRLAQMGEMISMIAHQWRQPLTAISATTNNLLIRMMINEKIDNEEFKNEISLISDYSQHLSMTIDDFRNFFKPDRDKTNITIEAIIMNSINIVKKSLESHGIKLIKDFNCNSTINVFASEVNQVVLNLIKNAEDAIIEKSIIDGEIKIKTYSLNNKCTVEISDNAKGIPRDIIENIFDPYFSTKKGKEGTGLGLYMSKIIINDHSRGNLSVSNGSLGAVFKIEIPLS